MRFTSMDVGDSLFRRIGLISNSISSEKYYSEYLVKEDGILLKEFVNMLRKELHADIMDSSIIAWSFKSKTFTIIDIINKGTYWVIFVS